ncbi:Uncharacterised protein [Streptococcus dysgalactiae subsp. equisimilis]|nr:Uncharacterised protein [Streptococcus dysgalactiae subsp. equisimilis]
MSVSVGARPARPGGPVRRIPGRRSAGRRRGRFPGSGARSATGRRAGPAARAVVDAVPHPALRRRGAIGVPGRAGQRQGLGVQRTAVGSQPGEQFRRQLADADEALDARHPIDLDQLQARLLSRGPGTAGRLAAPLAQQLLGALALLFEVDPAVAVGAERVMRSPVRPCPPSGLGVACAMRGVDRLGAALSAEGRRGERRRPL